MTTQTKTNPMTDNIETATERVSALSEKAVDGSRKASSALLESYEKTVIALADSYVKAARSTNVEWVANVADAQADFAREAAKSYTSAARTLID